MKLKQHIIEHFEQSIALHNQCKMLLADDIILATNAIIRALMNDGKVIICGNGGSAADAQHFSAELMGRFEQERMGLAAIALTTDSSILTAIANDYNFDLVFSKQVLVVGKKNDVLLAISTSGNSSNIIEAINAAHAKEISVIAMTGNNGGKMAGLLGTHDVLLNVPHHRTARIQEVHTLLIHIICDCIDKILFSQQNDLSL